VLLNISQAASGDGEEVGDAVVHRKKGRTG